MSPGPMTPDVLIVGGGVTGIEAALALRALAPRVRVRMLAASDRFVLLPAAMALAFRPDLPVSAPLSGLLADTGVEVDWGELREVRLPERQLSLGDGRELSYGQLVVAVGARRERYLDDRAIALRGPRDGAAARGLIGEMTEAVRAGVRIHLAVAVPPGPGWPLPAYEVAFLAATRFESEGVRDRAEISLLTAEQTPLGVFGPEASEAVGQDLERAGIRLRAGVTVGRWAHGEIELIPPERVRADRVVTTPRVRGPRLAGLPTDALGFVRADRDGRIVGAEDAFVVGDAGPFPIKQGGVGCAQADRVASLIARERGADVEEIPFEPTLRAFLLEGLEARYLRSRPTGGHEESLGRSWLAQMEVMTGKVAGRYLAPFLDSRMPEIRLRDAE